MSHERVCESRGLPGRQGRCLSAGTAYRLDERVNLVDAGNLGKTTLGVGDFGFEQFVGQHGQLFKRFIAFLGVGDTAVAKKFEALDS